MLARMNFLTDRMSVFNRFYPDVTLYHGRKMCCKIFAADDPV